MVTCTLPKKKLQISTAVTPLLSCCAGLPVHFHVTSSSRAAFVGGIYGGKCMVVVFVQT